MDEPLLSVAIGPDAARRELNGRARGIVAIGDIATGVIAIGGIARGLVAIGNLVLSPLHRDAQAVEFFRSVFRLIPRPLRLPFN